MNLCANCNGAIPDGERVHEGWSACVASLAAEMAGLKATRRTEINETPPAVAEAPRVLAVHWAPAGRAERQLLCDWCKPTRTALGAPGFLFNDGTTCKGACSGHAHAAGVFAPPQSAATGCKEGCPPGWCQLTPPCAHLQLPPQPAAQVPVVTEGGKWDGGYTQDLTEEWSEAQATSAHDEAKRAASYLLIDKLADPKARDSYNLLQRYATERRAAKVDADATIAMQIEALRASNDHQNGVIESLRAELASLRTENACDACAGAGNPASGLPCMCRGTGKMSVAALTLREELAALRTGAAPGDAVRAWRERGPEMHAMVDSALESISDKNISGRRIVAYRAARAVLSELASAPVAEKGAE